MAANRRNLVISFLFVLLMARVAHAALARIEVELIAPSQADAVTVATAINTFLAGKQLPSCSATETNQQAAVGQNESGQWIVWADVCFQVRTDAENWRADIVAKWTSGSLRTRILAGSRARFHMCSHGDPVIYSGTDSRAELSESRK